MIFGIDLATTNSLIAWLKDGVQTPVATVHGSVLLGATARKRLVTHPKRSAASFKRLMGTGQKLTLAGIH